MNDVTAGRTEMEKVAANTAADVGQVLTAFSRLPYGVISQEVGDGAEDLKQELTEICNYYKIYNKGNDFPIEGTNGDYLPANLNFKLAASLINKEARFLFGERPDIVIEPKGDIGKATDSQKEAIAVLNTMLEAILDKNHFERCLIQSARDSFIGKRIAILVNFNEADGVVITFLPSTQFYYETQGGNSGVITKFVAFVVTKDSRDYSKKRIMVKKFEREKDKIYMESRLYDGSGYMLEELEKRQLIKLSIIPVAIVLNDGLSGDEKGESEIELLRRYEKWYSRLSGADIDAMRKSMNPVRYAVDMEPRSTSKLPISPGAFWDLHSDSQVDKVNPSVGMLEPTMAYSGPLNDTTKRIKAMAYELVDIPDITLENLSGAIATGKGLKAIYWPLVARCKEKMKTWGPQLRTVVDIIIEGALLYPITIKRYTNAALSPVDYEVKVSYNSPLPEDEQEEKEMALAEITAGVRSRKSYLKEWHGMTDKEVDEELQQIALERQIIEDSAMPSKSSPLNADSEGMPIDSPPYPGQGVNPFSN